MGSRRTSCSLAHSTDDQSTLVKPGHQRVALPGRSIACMTKDELTSHSLHYACAAKEAPHPHIAPADRWWVWMIFNRGGGFPVQVLHHSPGYDCMLYQFCREPGGSHHHSAMLTGLAMPCWGHGWGWLLCSYRRCKPQLQCWTTQQSRSHHCLAQLPPVNNQRSTDCGPGYPSTLLLRDCHTPRRTASLIPCGPVAWQPRESDWGHR